MPAFATAAACLMIGGCAETGGGLGSAMLAGYGANAAIDAATAGDPQKAVEHWSKAYAENPRDLDIAISYARVLKTAGQKTQALAVLEQASLLHRNDRRLASEYGRLALELDNVSVAKPLLEAADDPADPDWRVIMARGTVLAKEGRYHEAASYYERALALKPDHPSIMSNLALAYAMSGEAAKAEELLRRASASSDASVKVRQNLALVLSLQGKYEEAKKIASVDLPADQAQENVDLLQNILRADPAPSESKEPQTKPATALTRAVVAEAWETEVVEGPALATIHKGPAGSSRRNPKSRAALVTTNLLHNIVNIDTMPPKTGAPPASALAFEPTAADTLSCLRQGGGC